MNENIFINIIKNNFNQNILNVEIDKNSENRFGFEPNVFDKG